MYPLILMAILPLYTMALVLAWWAGGVSARTAGMPTVGAAVDAAVVARECKHPDVACSVLVQPAGHFHLLTACMASQTWRFGQKPCAQESRAGQAQRARRARTSPRGCGVSRAGPSAWKLS